MPRPRYPSDDKRLRQRPHAKVHLSIRSHPQYGHVFDDPETRGIILGLWVLAVQYHASRSDDTVTLGLGDLAWLTGRERARAARERLLRACAAMNYPVSCDCASSPVPTPYQAGTESAPGRCQVGADSVPTRCGCRRVYVQVRNLQRKQGFDSATPAETPRTPSASEEPKNRRTEEPIKRAPNGARARRSAGKSPCPEKLPDDDRERAFVWAKSKGFTEAQLRYAWTSVRTWALANDRRRANWYAVLQGALREGWGLKGFKPPGPQLRDVTTERLERERLERERAAR